jgi:hypothetical protein
MQGFVGWHIKEVRKMLRRKMAGSRYKNTASYKIQLVQLKIKAS